MWRAILFGCTLSVALIKLASSEVECNSMDACPTACTDWPWQVDILDMPNVANRVDHVYDPIGDGSGVNIYIIDSGINYNHEEFLDANGNTRALPGYDYVAATEGVDECEEGEVGEDQNGHGTTVASLAVGRNVGAARGAKVYSVKVGNCNDSHLAVTQGMDFVDNVAQTDANQKIIVVISSETNSDDAFDRRVRSLTQNGVLVVAAAGHSKNDACTISPGGAPEAFTVGGMIRNSGLVVYPFTNYGACVNILAPASFTTHATLDTADGMGNCYETSGSGTSVAAPLVAGVAAIYWQRYPDLTVQQLKDRIVADAFEDEIRFEGDQANQGTPNKMIHVISKARIGDSEMEPAVSCSEIAMFRPDAPSGNYWLRGEDEQTFEVYCKMDAGLCGSATKGWRRIASVDMTDPNTQCPENSDLREITVDSKRLCCKLSDISGCSSMVFPSHQIKYQKVCGRIEAYQYGTVDGLLGYSCEGCTIEDPYVDGFSITHGSPGQRQHIWTLAANIEESETFCSCVSGSTLTQPAFIGNNYYCESGHTYPENIFKVLINDPLWDGQDCDGGEATCCQNSIHDYPWFTTTLNAATTDDLEVRLCTDEGYEDVPFHILEIYVQE